MRPAAQGAKPDSLSTSLHFALLRAQLPIYPTYSAKYPEWATSAADHRQQKIMIIEGADHISSAG